MAGGDFWEFKVMIGNAVSGRNCMENCRRN